MIPEAALLAQLELFRGYGYSRYSPQYPAEVPGVLVETEPPKRTNCSCFVEGLIVPVAARLVDGFEWSWRRHKQMMIMDRERRSSPIVALVNSGLAVMQDADDPPGDWAVMQGWSADFSNGHTLIVARHDTATDQVLTLEANCSARYDLIGVGHRGVGHIDNWPDFDLMARLQDSPYGWADLCDTYPNRAVCALHVG